MAKSIKKSFLIDPLATNSTIYSDSLKNIEILQKRALYFLYKLIVLHCTPTKLNFNNLVVRTCWSSANFRRLRTLSTEIYKTLDSFSPSFMKEIFEFKEANILLFEKFKLNLNKPKHNQVTAENKSFRVFGSKISNNLHFLSRHLPVQS